MKKYIFGGIAVLAIAIAVGINVNLNSQKSSDLSALSLANIETLATAERAATCTPIFTQEINGISALL